MPAAKLAPEKGLGAAPAPAPRPRSSALASSHSSIISGLETVMKEDRPAMSWLLGGSFWARESMAKLKQDAQPGHGFAF